MADNDRDFTAFTRGSSTAFPKTSTKVAPSTVATDEELETAASDNAVVDLTGPEATVSEPPKAPAAKPKPKAKPKKTVEPTASEPLVRTSLSLPAELVTRVGERADSEGIWKTDVVMDAIDAHLDSVEAAPVRRRRRRGNQNAAMSVSFEPSLVERLQKAGGEHGSMSWVVAQCLGMYLA